MGRGDHGLNHSAWRELGLADTVSITIDGEDKIGGDVARFIAGAATLLIGEVVYVSATKTVTKTATAATLHPLVCGVVVGGARTGMRVLHDANSVGLEAALTGEPVIVCVNGVVYVVADAAIVAGTWIAPSTTVAGRVRPAIVQTAAALTGAPTVGTLVIAAGATPVTSSAANGAIITGAPGVGTLAAPLATGDGLPVRIGKIWEAASTAADVRLARIML